MPPAAGAFLMVDMVSPVVSVCANDAIVSSSI